MLEEDHAKPIEKTCCSTIIRIINKDSRFFVSVGQTAAVGSTKLIDILIIQTHQLNKHADQETIFSILSDPKTALTVNRLLTSTSISPRSNSWHSIGTKWGIWKVPLFTFSSNLLKLSSSNGKAPWKRGEKRADEVQHLLANPMNC